MLVRLVEGEEWDFSVPMSGSMSFSRENLPPRGNELDVTEGASENAASPGRPWIQVWFECAGAYQKVFRSLDKTRYTATCPKCFKQMKFGVGPGGSSDRFFRVSC